MKLENQCISLVQAKRLKELGVEQLSLAAFFAHGSEFIGDEKPSLNNFYQADGDSFLWASAFTVAELGKMLPSEVYTLYTDTHWTLTIGWPTCIKMEDAPSKFMWVDWQTEAEARAEILIYLLEQEIIKPADINHRLTS